MFLDARDSHLVIHDDDAASVASDASTVVPDHHSASEEQQLGGLEVEEEAPQPQLPAADATQLEGLGQQAEQAAAPAELPELQPVTLQPAAAAMAEEQPTPVSVPTFSSGFAQPQPFQVEPAGLDAPFAAVPMRRSSLSPAPSAGQRRSSLGVALAQVQQEAESAPQQAVTEVHEAQAAQTAAPPAVEQPSPPSAEPAAPAAAPLAESSAAGAPLQPEASRLSLSSSVSAAPSLRIEFSEASLRYSGGSGGDTRWKAEGKDLCRMRCSVPVARLVSLQVPCATCSSLCPSCSAVELGLAHSPRSHRSNPSLERLPAVPASPAGPPAPEAELLPPAAAAATLQQARLSLVAAASPVAPANTPASPSLMGQAAAASRSALEWRSQPIPAAAVAQAIEAAAAESSGTEEAVLIRRLSLAELAGQPAQPAAEEQQPAVEQPADQQPARRTSFFSVSQVAEAAAAELPAAAPMPAAQPAEAAVVLPHPVPAAEAAATSPVPPTPYAATEYDGDDVVMMDIGEPQCLLC